MIKLTWLLHHKIDRDVNHQISVSVPLAVPGSVITIVVDWVGGC